MIIKKTIQYKIKMFVPIILLIFVLFQNLVILQIIELIVTYYNTPFL